MAFDFSAVAAAIAVRFGPTIVSAPSGETAITQSTSTLPDVISDDNVVLVFPPELDFNYGPSLRKALAIYPVRFFIYKVGDNPRNSAKLYAWLNAFYATLDAGTHLTLSTYVQTAVLESAKVGELNYGGIAFYGIEFQVRVVLGEGLSASN